MPSHSPYIAVLVYRSKLGTHGVSDARGLDCAPGECCKGRNMLGLLDPH